MVLEVAERLMARLHLEEEKKKISERRATGVYDAPSRNGGGGSRGTITEENRKETADKVASHQTRLVGGAWPTYPQSS